MSLLYDLYQPGDSWLHRLDPRVKVGLVFCGCSLLLLFRNVWLMLGALACVGFVLWSAGVARERMAWVARMTLPTMAMIAVLWVIFYRGEGRVLFSWWFLEVTASTIAEGLAVALRVGALALLILAWLFTTDQTTLVHSLVALGMPYEWGLTLAMALRYLPTMGNVFGMISDAQQARALDLTKGNPLKRARAYLPITVAMLITALRTAQSLSLALESRALGARRKRTYLHRLHFRRADLLWTIGIMLATAALLWARLVWGFGARPY
ncbi:MAG: energy-coupling factor transporter transmembrane protein EcfT [Chloroflexi bacterium]|nr:energy-coupling factor transporter transmembrane protein EcfT [Chloroflexota bacterium]